MAVDLTLMSRRENPILAPFLDRLRSIVCFSEATLYRAEADCFSVITYRGPIPQVHALSLSFLKESLQGLAKAIETGKPIITEETDSTIAQDVKNREPLRELIGRPPETTPRSLLALPLMSGIGSSYLLVLYLDKAQYYTPALAEQALQYAQQHMLTIENSARHSELVQRAAEAEVLLSVQRAIASRLDLKAVLQLIADEARNLTFANSALLLTLDGKDLILGAQSGRPLTLPSDCVQFFADDAAIDQLDATISSRRGNADVWFGGCAATWLGEHDFVVAPIRHGGQLKGLLVAVDKQLGVFGVPDERRLAMLTATAAFCLDNARLYRQASHVAVLKERDRLSGELHDELAQALGCLKMQASLVEQDVLDREWQVAQTRLAELKVMLDVAYSSVREAIFGLRYEVAGSSFFASLGSFLVDYRAYFGLNVTLEMTLDPLPEMKPETDLQLARIVQESLTNVRRHAAVSEVRVRVGRESGHTIVRITDNGNGFDLDAVLSAKGPHHGLQIMRERAETFGGRVQYKSTLGCGCEIAIYIPDSEE